MRDCGNWSFFFFLPFFIFFFFKIITRTTEIRLFEGKIAQILIRKKKFKKRQVFKTFTVSGHVTGSQLGRKAVSKMAIFSVYVVNKAGGLIYQYDNYVPRTEVEKTFSHPLDLVLKHHDEKVVVSFGQRDGIKGNILLQTLQGRFMLQTVVNVLFDVLL